MYNSQDFLLKCQWNTAIRSGGHHYSITALFEGWAVLTTLFAEVGSGGHYYYCYWQRWALLAGSGAH